MNHLRFFAALAVCLATASTAVASCCSSPCPEHPERDGPCDAGVEDAAPGACPAAGDLLSGADPAACSAVQLACAVIPDIGGALAQPTFAAQSDYDRLWKARADVWITLLDRISTLPGQEEAQSTAKKASTLLTVTAQDEEARRSMLQGGNMTEALSGLRGALGSPACGPP